MRLDANQGKAEEVAQFLLGGKAIVDEEPGSSTWFAIRLSPTTFGIFDAFPNEVGRNAHLAGRVAALIAKALDLLEHPPVIEKNDVLAVKLPMSTCWKTNNIFDHASNLSMYWCCDLSSGTAITGVHVTIVGNSFN